MAINVGRLAPISSTIGYVSADCPCGNPFRVPVGATTSTGADGLDVDISLVEIKAHWRVHVRLFHKGRDDLPADPPSQLAA